MALIGYALRLKAPALLIFCVIFSLGHVVPILTKLGLLEISYSALPPERSDYDQQTLAMAFLACLGVVAGYFAWRGKAPTRPALIGRRWVRSDALDALPKVTWALIGVILALVTFPAGGPIAFLEINFVRVIPEHSTIATAIYLCAVICAVLATVQLVIDLQRGRHPRFVQLAVTSMIFWSMGGRLQFSVTVAAYALAMLRYRYLSKKALWILVLASALPVFATIYIRLSLQGRHTTLGESVTHTLDELSMLGSYNLAVQYVAEAGHQPLLWLSQLESLLPRAFNPDKPQQISRLFRQLFWGDELGGVPPALVGEFYIIGGLAFCMIGGLLLGHLLRRLDQLYRYPQGRSVVEQAAIFAFIPLVSFYLVRVGMDSSIFRIVLSLLVFGGLGFVIPKAAVQRFRKLSTGRQVLSS
ncbi:MAG TPA: hypothetical protein VMK31_09270 [Sphingomicrobium sp.]|nr:hypothetical protein [Sphingomicrobium sp.]